MAKKKNKINTNNKGKEQAPNLTVPELNKRTAYDVNFMHIVENVYRLELSDWVNAREARLDPFNPITYYLQQLYKDTLLDNHLAGAIENQRILPLLNKSFVIRDASGKVIDDATASIQGEWFSNIIRYALESKFFGYSLMFVDNLNSPDRIVMKINREAIIPEKGMILQNPLDPQSNGIHYEEFPSYFLYASLGNDNIGQLLAVAPMTIYKRHSWASWDQLEQIFGLPIRIARTAIQSTDNTDKIQHWLETMGTASYAIFGMDTQLEIAEAKHTDTYHIYLEKIKAANSEISKRILGQTMTSEDGSSQSQAEVHLKILQDVQHADMRNVINWVNSNLLPILRLNGFAIPEDATFDIIEQLNIKPLDKIKIDQVLLQNGYNLDKDYLEDTYGTIFDKANPRTINSGAGENLNFFE